MKKHILVVDKNPLILYALEKALKGEVREVKTACTTVEAVEKLSERPYNLCLVDVQIADFDRYGLKKTIHDISPETKIIMMTTESPDQLEGSKMYLDDEAQRNCFLIPKPFAICDISDVVKQVLNGEEEAIFVNGLLHNDHEEKKARRHARTTCDGDLCFRMSVIHGGICTRLSMEAQIVDISDSGIGLLTSYPLRETQVVGFDDKMNNKVGVVAWSRMISKERFRVGVRFA